MATQRTVVVVGGGFGGLETVKRLRAPGVRVILIDRSNHHLFQPLLYQVATAGLSPAEIATPIRRIFRNRDDVEVWMDEVVGVQPGLRRANLASGRSIAYDALVIATGASHAYFGHGEWEAFAPGLKSLDDATRLRAKILTAFEAAETAESEEERVEWLTFVIVGAGPTGVEMAGSIAELADRALQRDFRHIDPSSARIVLVEAGPRVLSSFPEDMSQSALDALHEMRIEVRLNDPVERIEADRVITRELTIPCRTAFWAAGVQASHAATWLGVEGDRVGRVPVNPDCSVPRFPDIFVIGDTASHAAEDGRPLPGVAQVAIQQGHYVADLLARRFAGGKAPGPFRYRDLGSMATIGRRKAVAVFGPRHVKGTVAWLLWLFVHLMALVGYRNRLLVLTQWAWAYLAWERGARLITGGLPAKSRAGKQAAVEVLAEAVETGGTPRSTVDAPEGTPLNRT